MISEKTEAGERNMEVLPLLLVIYFYFKKDIGRSGR
jgi:hypothetical protein